MARKEKTIHYLYKTTCNVTGRYYIGMHSTYNLEDNYMGSGKRLRYSIRKYGVENHTKEILEFLPTREELVLREIEIVTKELIDEPMCMNLVIGGQGGFISLEGVKKGGVISGNLHKQRLITDIEYSNKHKKNAWNNLKKYFETGKRSLNNFEGKTHSEETKKLMSEIKKGTGTGESNSQYGTCWITKEGINKKIKKEDLETYLNEGWVKGRK